MANENNGVTNQPIGKGVTKINPVSLPGFGPSNASDNFDPSRYKVKYAKIDFDDLGSVSILEILETRAIHNTGIFILSKDRYNFMDKAFMLVSYLEETPSASSIKSST